jgi:hypothetical protein
MIASRSEAQQCWAAVQVWFGDAEARSTSPVTHLLRTYALG